MQTIGSIETCYPTFTKSERKVADYILEHRREGIEHITLAEFSSMLGVGEATIVRFCRKIDLKGFQELKFTLAVESAEANDPSEGKREDIKCNLINIIEMTDEMVSQKQIDSAVEMIRKAEDIYFFGIGTSGLSASMGEARLFRFGKRTKAVTDSHVQSMQASLCDENSLIITVSVSGETKDMVEAVSLAKETGARIIVITNHMHSTLAKLGDCVLISYGKTNVVNAGTFSTMVSQMFLLDLIISGYAIRYINDTAKPREKIARSVMNKIND